MKNRLISLLIAAVLAVVFLSGIAAAEELEVHLGDQPSFFILKIADYNGYFTEEFEGTGVKIVVDNFVNQGSAIVEAMNAGNVQLGVIGTMPLVTADANGSGFKALASVNLSVDGFKLYAGAGKGITTVEEFKGKKIAVKFSSNEHEMLLTLLAKAGLGDTDVEIVNMSADDSLNSLITGDVDGAILKGDQLNAANASGANIVADNSQSGLIGNYLIGREDFITAHPEVVTGVLKVLEKARIWIDENPEKTVDIFAGLTNTDKEVTKTSFESRTRSISIDEDKFAAPINRTLEFLKGQGTIDDSLKLEDILDPSYYTNAGISEK
ncbi:MAG: aliphatic sulfonate ABC transporter substrate-binding protein [Clostridiales bacterium]|nr:aliphatic sulfonate ABC transporter substrate-binding protein [Clostridiales bacterium]